MSTSVGDVFALDLQLSGPREHRDRLLEVELGEVDERSQSTVVVE